MKKKRSIVFIILLVLLGIMNIKVCFAHTIFRELPVGRIEKGRISIDNCEDGEDDNDFKEASYFFSYDTDGKRQFKYTVTISNIRKA